MILVAIRLARRWWWIAPAWVLAEYVVAPVVVAALSPLVFGELLPQVWARVAG